MVVSVPPVYVILLNWNQKELTCKCLDSLRVVDYPNLHVTLVDNGSTDGTQKIIKECYPEVDLIENEKNLGFAEGNNVGIRRAIERNADFIMLLNNDTVVAPDFLSLLIDQFNSDPNTGVVTPKILYLDQPGVIWSAGAHIDWRSGNCLRLQADETDDFEDLSPKEVNFASGCALCARREVLEKVGLLDSRFFLYFEEADWCSRVTRAGYDCVYVPASRIWHKVSASIGVNSPDTAYYFARNELLFVSRNYRGLRRMLMIFKKLAASLRTAAAYTLLEKNRHLAGHRDAILLGIRDALLGNFGEMRESVRLKIHNARQEHS